MSRAPARPSPARPTAQVCECSHLDVVHDLARDKRTRTACSVHTGAKCTPCGCPRFEAAAQPNPGDPMSLLRRSSTEPHSPNPPAEHVPAGDGRPAISLEKVQAAAPGLVDLYKKAGVSLQKNGLAGARAAVYLVLDRSGSMRGFYKDGSVQLLAEQALGLSAQLDDDGTVPTIFFDSRAYPAVDVDLADYVGRVDREHRALGPMGTTDYAAAMQAVIMHYQASGATAPAFVIFQTDGSPDSRRDAERVLCQASSLPIFWQFIGFGGDSFSFLRKLDDLAVPGRRVVDNAGFFAAGSDPRQIPDGELYDRLMGEFPSWLGAARAAGILT